VTHPTGSFAVLLLLFAALRLASVPRFINVLARSLAGATAGLGLANLAAPGLREEKSALSRGVRHG
jgi:hypothetical protein